MCFFVISADVQYVFPVNCACFLCFHVYMGCKIYLLEELEFSKNKFHTYPSIPNNLSEQTSRKQIEKMAQVTSDLYSPTYLPTYLAHTYISIKYY